MVVTEENFTNENNLGTKEIKGLGINTPIF